MVKACVSLLATMLACLPASAQQISPWTETVVSVRDLEKSSALFMKLGDWRITSEGDISNDEIRYWKLPSTVKARYRRICAPKAETGCIRFVRIDSVNEQKTIRAALRPWDTGGIFSIMVRSDNVEQLYRDALKMGWWAESRPIRFQFGKSDLRNVVLTGPHGVNLAVYERISPAFEGFPLGRISEGFNSMRMVKNKDRARDFYVEKLGFKILFDADSDFDKPAYSNLSIPFNYTDKIKRVAAALYPLPGETGRVEVMQIKGFTGRDVRADAKLPNLGIISLRYPVTGLSAYRSQVTARGVRIAYQGKGISLAGIGKADIFAVRDLDGNLTEFYEVTGD